MAKIIDSLVEYMRRREAGEIAGGSCPKGKKSHSRFPGGDRIGIDLEAGTDSGCNMRASREARKSAAYWDQT